jgi:hypothetical protein
MPGNKGKMRQEHASKEKWILAYLFQLAQSNFGTFNNIKLAASAQSCIGSQEGVYYQLCYSPTEMSSHHPFLWLDFSGPVGSGFLT